MENRRGLTCRIRPPGQTLLIASIRNDIRSQYVRGHREMGMGKKLMRKDPIPFVFSRAGFGYGKVIGADSGTFSRRVKGVIRRRSP
jgi:hypothetical protein